MLSWAFCSEPPTSPLGASATLQAWLLRLQDISPLASSPPHSQCTSVSAVSSCADLSVAPSADLYVCPVSVSVSFSPSLLLPRFSLFLPVSPAALPAAGLCVLPGPCTLPQIPANLCLLPLSLSFRLGLCLTLHISGLAVSDYTSLSLFLCCVCLHLWLLQRGETGLGEGSKGATFPLPCWSLCLLREVRLASLSPAE